MSNQPKRRLLNAVHTDPEVEQFLVMYAQLKDATRRAVADFILNDRALPITKADSVFTDARRNEAIRCIAEVSAVAGEWHSMGEYEAVRKMNPSWDLRSARQLLRWLGVSSWNEARAEAGLAAIPEPDTLAREVAQEFAADELLAALRDYHADNGELPTMTQYMGWARRTEVRRRPGRRPFSTNPFVRMFGSFGEALQAAGLVSDDVDPTLAAMVARTTRISVPDTEIVGDILAVSERLGCVPLSTDYFKERKKMQDEGREDGRRVVMASLPFIRRRFGSWGGALKAAGLDPTEARQRRTKSGSVRVRRPYWSREQCLAAVRQSVAELGLPGSARSYDGWRLHQIRSNPMRAYELPAVSTILRFFSPWREAVQAMINDEAAE
jgi:hypothetical protein